MVIIAAFGLLFYRVLLQICLSLELFVMSLILFAFYLLIWLLLLYSEAALRDLAPSIDLTMARRLARRLSTFRSFQSLDKESVGIECVKIQLKKLSLIAGRRKRRLHQQGASSSANEEVSSSKASNVPPLDGAQQEHDQAKIKDPHHILKHVVGEEKHSEILSVYHAIKHIRRYSAIWTKFSSQHQKLPGESSPSCSSEEEDYYEGGEEIITAEQNDRPPASEALPGPISDIYFSAWLMNVMNVVDGGSCSGCKPLEVDPTRPVIPDPSCGCIVYRTDWDGLLQDAKMKLSAFRKFEKEHVGDEEDLSFKCSSSGLCFRPSRMP